MTINKDAKKQHEKSKHKAPWLQPWQFQPGQSGNVGGRPPGKSLKQYAKEFLSKLNDKEREEYFKGLDKIDIWKMAEGGPTTNVGIEVEKESLQTLTEFFKAAANDKKS